MKFSQELSDLWELFGDFFGEITRDLHKLHGLIQRNPQFWTWLTVWLGVVWICLRWSNIAAQANERRIFQAAEARLSHLIREANNDHVPGDDGARAADSVSSTEAEAQAPEREKRKTDRQPQETLATRGEIAEDA